MTSPSALAMSFGVLTLLVACVDDLETELDTAHESQSSTVAPCPSGPGFCSTQTLFAAGQVNPDLPNYVSYRIPSIVRGKHGRLIAIAEARRYSNADSGDIDVVYRTSDNDGQDWAPLKRMWSKHGNTCGNPTALYDATTETVWVMLNYNDGNKAQRPEAGQLPIGEGDRKVYVTSYDHQSDSFALPINISSHVQPPGTVWDAVGPGLGTQLRHGANAGRLVFPAIGRHIYSDDHGATWTYGMVTNPGTSESTLVELNDGALLRNDRAATAALKCVFRRPLSVSEDDGESWSPWDQSNTLLAPGHPEELDYVCPPLAVGVNRNHASSMRYTEGKILNRIMFTNAASTIKRRYMTLRISYDEGETWPTSRRLYAPLSGYSALVKTADKMTGVLYETLVDGDEDDEAVHDIVFHKVNLSWILNGRSEPNYIGGNAWLGDYPERDQQQDNYWSPETGWIFAPGAATRSASAWVFIYAHWGWFWTEKDNPGVFIGSSTELTLW